MKRRIIDRVYLRAKDNHGEWGSFSLAELIEMHRAGYVLGWILEKVCDYKEGEIITAEHIEKLLKALPKFYVSLKTPIQ